MTGTPQNWDEVNAWRKALRVELLARREAVPQAERAVWNTCITDHLLASFEVPLHSVVGLCWPYRAEFDARFAMRRWREQGAVSALPEVVARDRALVFRRWWPGAPMRAGVYGIPVPDGTDALAPDVALVPMNACDGRGYRLGYGGGYFDATLAALGQRVASIGITYECLRIETIHPQPHDLPMDFVVTEAGVHAAGGAPLERLCAGAARTRFAQLLAQRGLPRAAHVQRGYSSPACYAADFPGYFGDEKD